MYMYDNKLNYSMYDDRLPTSTIAIYKFIVHVRISVMTYDMRSVHTRS